MQMWGGRFKGKMDADAWEFNASLLVDKRLAVQDVKGSIAWAKALEMAGVLNADECLQIKQGLQTILKEFENNTFQFVESDEDIHTAVERRLGELIGDLAGKLHSGRSRNDQVATDFRLWMLENLPILDKTLNQFQSVLLTRAKNDFGIIMPGYTHLQRAQPILLSHWWLSFFWQIARDRKRLQHALNCAGTMPLGSGALAGTSFPIERTFLAYELGFPQISNNSIDAVADRDFAAEFLFMAAMLSVHLSRLSEMVILFTSSEFSFFELDDAYATGSSLMPQKKNPDVFELTRAKAGVIIGKLTSILALLKGLPSTYDKDLQEDKLIVFDTFDILFQVLTVLTKSISTIKVKKENMLKAIDDNLYATDMADYLVKKGLPFREAHRITGAVVRYALENNVQLSKLSLERYQDISTSFSADVFELFNPQYSIATKNAEGGTSPLRVQQQIELAEKDI